MKTSFFRCAHLSILILRLSAWREFNREFPVTRSRGVRRNFHCVAFLPGKALPIVG